MGPATALATGRRRDGVGDVARFHSLGDQIVGDGHVDPGALASCEQHRNSALMLRAEAVHRSRNLRTIIEIGFCNMQLHVTDLFHRPLFPAPGSSLQQLGNLLFQLPILVEHRFDAACQMFGLRLE